MNSHSHEVACLFSEARHDHLIKYLQNSHWIVMHFLNVLTLKQ